MRPKAPAPFQTDMDKKTVERLLKDERLDALLKRTPISPNTFLKAHFDGLMLATPDTVLVGWLICSKAGGQAGR